MLRSYRPQVNLWLAGLGFSGIPKRFFLYLFLHLPTKKEKNKIKEEKRRTTVILNSQRVATDNLLKQRLENDSIDK